MDPLRKSDPEFIGPARLVARLGSGGMGTVYLASIDNSSVALKVVKGNFYDDPALKTRFEREISTMQTLRSPFVATVIDSLVDEDDAWMAVEFINGESLSERVRNRGPIENEEWWTTLFGALIALDEIHSNGILHRDVKPANILLSESGPKFVDFGIAQAGEETSLTTTGLLAGTPAWLAPEQLEEKRPTPAADIFSLASTMVFAATASSPWGSPTGTKVPVIFNRILTDPPRVDALTEAQREVLEPMLEKDPRKRPSAEDLISNFLIGQSSVVKRKIAGWISLYYLDRGVSELPEKEAASRVLRLLDRSDEEARVRDAKIAQLKREEEREDLIRTAEKTAEDLRKIAERDAKDTRLRAEKEASALRIAAQKEAEALLAKSRKVKVGEELNRNPAIRKKPFAIFGALAGVLALTVFGGLGYTFFFEGPVSTREVVEPPNEVVGEETDRTVNVSEAAVTESAVLFPSEGAIVTAGNIINFVLQFEPTYEVDGYPSIALVPLNGQAQAAGCPLRGKSPSQDLYDLQRFKLSCSFNDFGIYAVRATWSGNFPGEEPVLERLHQSITVAGGRDCFDQEEVWWLDCMKPVVLLPRIAENSNHGYPTDYSRITGVDIVQSCERLYDVFIDPQDGIAGTSTARTLFGSDTTMVSTQWYAKLQLLDTNQDGILCSSTTPD